MYRNAQRLLHLVNQLLDFRKGEMSTHQLSLSDELNSHLGMIRSYPIDGESVKQLIEIQNVLFVVGANLATDTTVSNMQKKLPCTDEDVAFLERAIDKMDEELPPLQYFVLPGGRPEVSACHIARTVCRRVTCRSSLPYT